MANASKANPPSLLNTCWTRIDFQNLLTHHSDDLMAFVGAVIDVETAVDAVVSGVVAALDASLLLWRQLMLSVMLQWLMMLRCCCGASWFCQWCCKGYECHFDSNIWLSCLQKILLLCRTKIFVNFSACILKVFCFVRWTFIDSDKRSS